MTQLSPRADGRLCRGNFLPAAALPGPIAFSHRTSPPRTCEDLLRSSRALAALASRSQFSPQRSSARPCPSLWISREECCSCRSSLWPCRMRRPSQLRQTFLPTPPVLPQALNTSSSHSTVEAPSPLRADGNIFAVAAFFWLSAQGLLRARNGRVPGRVLVEMVKRVALGLVESRGWGLGGLGRSPRCQRAGTRARSGLHGQKGKYGAGTTACVSVCANGGQALAFIHPLCLSPHHHCR